MQHPVKFEINPWTVASMLGIIRIDFQFWPLVASLLQLSTNFWSWTRSSLEWLDPQRQKVISHSIQWITQYAGCYRSHLLQCHSLRQKGQILTGKVCCCAPSYQQVSAMPWISRAVERIAMIKFYRWGKTLKRTLCLSGPHSIPETPI